MGLINKVFGGSSSQQAPPPPPPAGVPVTVQTAEASVRVGFIRKVYMMLTINFVITIGISCIFTFVDPIQEYLESPQGSWTWIAAFAASIVTLIALACFKPPFPFSLILMYVFVLAQSALVGVIVSMYWNRGYGKIVLQAFILTIATFIGITLYCAFTKKDFSFLYGFLSAASLVLILSILFNFAFGWVSGKVSRAVSFGISVAGYEIHLQFNAILPHLPVDL